MVKEPRYGKMVLNMKGIGEMEWLRVKVTSIMQMVMYILENFTKIEPMVSVYMYIRTAKLMKVFGGTICKTVLEKRN